MPHTPTATRTMTKADLVERVYEQVGFSKKEAAEVVEAVFESMKQALEQGDKIKVS
ncbi:MAG: integration host factor subunit alpha, partial [Cognaticolwellia sp.]